MRISKIRIENFRTFKDMELPFDNYSVLIGSNGSGKSTILLALKVFFGDSSSTDTSISILQKEDFHNKEVTNPIKITLTFVDLNADAQSDFKDYFRQGELVICAKAVWNDETKTAKVERFGWRKVMPAFAPYFDAKGNRELVAVLREVYKGIRVDVADLPAETTEAKMTAALRTYEADHVDECKLLESADQFFGISAGVDKFRKHIQWIFIPAIKNALDEQTEGKNTVLGQILARTVRASTNFDEEIKSLKSELHSKYKTMLDSKDEALSDLSEILKKKLQEWAHPNCSLYLKWTSGSNNPVHIDSPYAEAIGGEGIFEGNLTRFGHGFLRSYIFTLLHVLSNVEDENSPTMILGCEEPELFQHPPQLRHLAEVFRKLSAGNSQIILCTHSPHFVTGEDFEDVRLVRKEPLSCASTVSNCTMAQIGDAISEAYSGNRIERPMGTLLKIHQSLQPELNEMFFAQTVVLVEGPEDLAYLTTYLHLLDKWTEFRRLGCHIVPARGKSNLIRPLAVANALKISRFVIFDSDNHIPDNGNGNRVKHEKDNKALLYLLGASGIAPFPTENEWGEDFVVWKSEIGKVVAEELEPIGFQAILEATRKKYGDSGNLEKDSLFIADALEEAWKKDGRSESLEKLCNSILSLANK